LAKKWIFALIGFLLGGPLSYFFQSEMLRLKIPFGEYAIRAHLMLLDSRAWQNDPFIGNVALTILITCVVCTVCLYFVGYSLDKKGG